MGKYFSYPKGHGKALVKMAKEDPSFLDELREYGESNAVKYIEAALMNEEIMAFCKEHKITTLDDLKAHMEKDHPEWDAHLKAHPGSFAVIVMWLEKQAVKSKE